MTLDVPGRGPGFGSSTVAFRFESFRDQEIRGGGRPPEETQRATGTHFPGIGWRGTSSSSTVLWGEAGRGDRDGSPPASSHGTNPSAAEEGCSRTQDGQAQILALSLSSWAALGQSASVS